MKDEEEAFDVLWGHVLEEWDNPKAHDAFLQMAVDRRALGQAAGRYRTQLDNEDRRELADKKLKASVLLATQEMEARKSVAREQTPRWVLVAAASVCALAVGLLLWSLAP
jgi:hypothetical protein